MTFGVNSRSFPWGHTGFYGGSQPIPRPAGPIFNVKDFGAKGDGVTDDWAAVNAARFAATQRNVNWQMVARAIVFFPAGTYLLGQPFPTMVGTLWRGEGVNVTTLRFTRTGVELMTAFPLMSPWNTSADLRYVPAGFIGSLGPDHTPLQFTLATVTANAQRGSQILSVNDTGKLSVGQLVQIMLDDPLGNYAQMDDLMGPPYPTALRETAGSAGGITKFTGVTTLGLVRYPLIIRNIYPGNNSVMVDPPIPFNVTLSRGNARLSWCHNNTWFTGVEDMTIFMKESNWSQGGTAVRSTSNAGNAALYFVGNANAWVRNVEIVNADIGIQLSHVQAFTVENVTFRDSTNRGVTAGPTGAFGIQVKGVTAGCRFSNIRFNKVFQTDVHLFGATYVNVFNNIIGASLQLDLWNLGAYGNLFSNINVGRVGRPFWGSVHRTRNFTAAAYNTFWNVYSDPSANVGGSIASLNFTGISYSPLTFVNTVMNTSLRVSSLDAGDGWSAGERTGDLAAIRAELSRLQAEEDAETQQLDDIPPMPDSYKQGARQQGRVQRAVQNLGLSLAVSEVMTALQQEDDERAAAASLGDDGEEDRATAQQTLTSTSHWNEVVTNLGPADLLPPMAASALRSDVFDGHNGAPYGCEPSGSICYYDARTPACSSNALGASQLWGCDGELYSSTNPAGHLIDFRYAGITGLWDQTFTFPNVVDITTFGAIPNDGASDSDAFTRAIATVTRPAVLFIPAGTYNLDKVLNVNGSNLILRGAGVDRTILSWSTSLTDVIGNPGLANNSGSSFAYIPALLNLNSTWNGIPSNLRVNVTAPVPVNSNVIPVNSVANFRVGQRVVIIQHDRGGGLIRELYGDGYNINLFPNGFGTTGNNTSSTTKFYATVTGISGNSLTISRRTITPLGIDATSPVGYWAQVVPFEVPSAERKGVQDLTIHFPTERYPGHFNERGYNGIYGQPGLVDSFVSNVKIVNADVAIVWFSSFGLIKDVVIDNSARATQTLAEGYALGYSHYGVEVGYSDNNLIQNVTIQGFYLHDISYYGLLSCTVARGIKCTDCAVDFHRSYPHHNLITNVNLGFGTRGIVQGGVPRQGGTAWAAGNVFWNLKGEQSPGLPYAVDFGPNAILSGYGSREWYSGFTQYRWLVENNHGTYPLDLWAAQRAKWGVPTSI